MGEAKRRGTEFTTKYRFLIKNGERVRVLRPDKPEIVLRLAKDVMEADDELRPVLFQHLPERAQALGVVYTFVGYLSEAEMTRMKGGIRGYEPVVLSEDGARLGPTEPGDSYLSESSELTQVPS
jgi:hypothetical protein